MIETRNYGLGTALTQSYPWGTYIARGSRAICSDGVVRAVTRVASTADTFFSVPAAVRVSGRTVSGYVTIDTADGYSTETDDDPAVVKFIAYSYGANGHLLPGLAWKRTAVSA